MDILLRERNGKEEIWYSDKYLKEQIELAYRAGIHKGIKVKFHAITPMDGVAVDDLIHKFNQKVEEEFQKAYNDNEVWRVSTIH
jgi:hypothetical protein